MTVSLGPVVAHAGPKESLAAIKRDIAATQHKLADLQQRAEVAAERYDAGVAKLADAQRVATQKEQAASAAQQRLATIRRQLGVFAAQMYMGGEPGALALVDEAQDPQTVVDRAAYSDQLSQQKAATLAAVDIAEHDAAVTAKAAEQAVAAQRAVVASLAADKKQVDDAARQTQSLLGHLQAKQRELVHEIEVAAARARAAARRAAERAAARARAAAAAAAAQRAAAAQAQHVFDSHPSAPSSPAPAPSSASSGSAVATAVAWARREVGKPYVWAAAGPDAFDCSGLTMYVYAKAGIYLPHFAASQYGMGTHVSQGALRPGDLVFFGSPIHHVGIYVGGGQMIEAPHTGADVRYSSIARPDYVGATRLAG